MRRVSAETDPRVGHAIIAMFLAVVVVVALVLAFLPGV